MIQLGELNLNTCSIIPCAEAEADCHWRFNSFDTGRLAAGLILISL